MKIDIEYLEFLVESINVIEYYIENVSEEEFLRNIEKKDACLTRLIMIGEYSGKISEDTKSKFTDIEWQLMKAARNYYVHAYRGIDWVRVWDTIVNDLPPLKSKFENILDSIR